MGVTGAVLAIPIAAGVQVVLQNYFAARQVRRDSQQPSGWRWMLNRAGGRFDESPVTVVEQFPDDGTQTESDHLVPGAGPGEPSPASPPNGAGSREGASAPASATPPPRPAGDAPATSRRQWAPFSTPGQAKAPDPDRPAPEE
jgi:hypothetical protein